MRPSASPRSGSAPRRSTRPARARWSACRSGSSWPRPCASRVCSAAPPRLRAAPATAGFPSLDPHARSSRRPCPCCASGNARRRAAPPPPAAAFRRASARLKQLVLRHRGADLDPAAHVADRVELRDARDVDQHRWIGEPQVHHRHQRLAAGQHAGLVAVFGEHGDGLVGAVGPHIVERARLHSAASFCVISAWMRRGVAGSRTSSRRARRRWRWRRRPARSCSCLRPGPWRRAASAARATRCAAVRAAGFSLTVGTR